ncbi:MAG: low molecular weight protein arginine phosphatase [Chloroflexi bacterium]|nr:low molecular weight protein arginine phosphatase [Chloroflexota bacterium]
MKTILIVCTANICRSPMAAALLRKRIADLGLADQVAVESAGVWAREGFEASAEAIAVLNQRGIALEEHRSRPVSVTLLQEADIILVMEEAHRRSLFYLAPQHLGKVFLLTEMSGGDEDVADPYGGEIKDYTVTVKLLEKLIEAGLPQMLARLKINPLAATAPSAA